MRDVFADWPGLVLFTSVMLSAAIYGLAAAGHFPREHRAAVFETLPGRLILWGTIGTGIAAGLAGLAFAYQRLPIYAAVIAGGLAILIAPLCVQALPDRVVDSRGGLLAFAGTAAVLAVVAVWL